MRVDRFHGGLPTLVVTMAELAEGIPIVDVLTLLGLAESRSAARRLIRQGAVRLNGGGSARETKEGVGMS